LIARAKSYQSRKRKRQAITIRKRQEEPPNQKRFKKDDEEEFNKALRTINRFTEKPIKPIDIQRIVREKIEKEENIEWGDDLEDLFEKQPKNNKKYFKENYPFPSLETLYEEEKMIPEEKDIRKFYLNIRDQPDWKSRPNSFKNQYLKNLTLNPKFFLKDNQPIEFYEALSIAIGKAKEFFENLMNKN